MKKILIAALLCAPASMLAQDCQAYFPMQEGTKFTISSYDKKDKYTGKVMHEVTSYTATDANNVSVDVTQTSYDKKDEEVYTSEYTMACVDGVFALDMSVFVNNDEMAAYQDMETEVDATNLDMPLDPVAGQELNDGSVSVKIGGGGVNMFNMTVNITNRKVEAIEDITTDAGTFTCVKISYDVETKMLIKVRGSVVEWYALDVGTVRSESYNKKGDLTGYSVLTEFSK